MQYDALYSKENFNIAFDLKIAVECAKLCQIVYGGYSEIKEILPKEYSLVEYFDKKNSQAILVQDKQNNNWLIFRGTELDTIGDLITDIKIRKENIGIGEVHRGFRDALTNISNNIDRAVYGLDNIYIAGHSLGGALATLYTTHFTFDLGLNLKLKGIYTFGSPRVGNTEFAKNYNMNLKDVTYRMVNNCDIVTRIPTRLTGYSHCGQLIYIDKDGKLHIDDAPSMWETFWDRVKGRLEDFAHLKLLGGISDHSIEEYIKILEMT